jgi:aquaporin Z
MKKYTAEFIGTFVLVLVGCGTAAATGCSENADAAYVLTALAFGGVIAAMAYSIGSVSGCHINPAVSLAVYLNKGMSRKDLFGYWAAQFLGGICGAGVLKAVLSGTGIESLGANGLNSGVSAGAALLIELLLTFVFVLAVLGATSRPENSSVAGLVIAASLTLVHLMGIRFTGTSVNPARSLGPALFTGGEALANVWIFIVGPLLGGFLAAEVWKYLNAPEKKA